MAELVARTPADWQAEARARLAGLAAGKPRPVPESLRSYVDEQRTKAALAVRQASAVVVREACRQAQREAAGSATASRYRAVTAEEIYRAVPLEQQWVLCLGPKRTMRAVVRDAAELLPPEEFRACSRQGWRSLGAAFAPTPYVTQQRGTRTRSGLPVRRDVRGA